MNQQDNKFNYTYSAPTEKERKEVEDIRRRYLSSNDNTQKLERLRQLDAKVRNRAKIIGITIGVIGILIFGLGMSMALVWELFIWGSIVAGVGLLPMAFAYPLFNKVLELQKKKYKDEILTLSNELLNEN